MPGAREAAVLAAQHHDGVGRGEVIPADQEATGTKYKCQGKSDQQKDVSQCAE